MSKKTPVKKSKRRLKRSVRRSLSAVLMITAIAVAAIPVPDNAAAGDGGDGSSTPVIQYVDADPNDYEPNDDAKNDYANKSINSSEVTNAIENGTLVPTEVIIKDGTNTYLTWQFLYKVLTKTTGILCKYNDRFAVEEVDLGLQPVSHYYAITSADFEYYFTDPTKVSQELSNDMDNLIATSLVYPTKQITYSYDNYNYTTNSINDSSGALKKFLNDYYEDEYAAYTAKFKEYYDSGEQGDKPTDSLTVSPSRLGTEDKIKFFCEHNTVLSGTEYSLTPVTDYRFGKDGSPVYVAYGGDPDKLSGGIYGTIYEDYKGYIVTKDKHSITTIGEKAFYNVTNVGEIKISGQVGYIGDSAFEGAGISTLYIGNAEMIGNRAFYGCATLKTVTIGPNSGITVIGDEAFRHSGIKSKLSLPYTVKKIGHGAFSDCADLQEVEFDQENNNTKLVLEDFAFYNDKQLTKVDFGKIGVESMGKGCFAIQSPSGDSMTEFSFPAVRLATLGEYVLANRRSLKTVSIPYYQKKIPETTFYNCFGLEKVQFSEDSANASFDPKLFYDVTNTAFCVYGPEFYNDADTAQPRISTWDAVRKDEQGIPYVYERDGKLYYEVALESQDGTRYRYAAGNDGELISCALITKNPGDVDIVIPSKIGTFDIKKIGGNCFSDETLREHIKSITIEDDSVSEIADGAFKELPKLSKVWLGDSVTSIGANAFAGCKNLFDVYFTKPAEGYKALTIGEDAFVTTGSQLTFHGDIVKEYAPFEWAINEQHVLNSDNDNLPEVNICYQSLWDSEVGTHLTVMCDKNGVVTLLDYPKFNDLSEENVKNDEELQDYCSDMENYYYYTVYDTGNDVEQWRKEYALLWNAKQNNDASVDLGDGVIINSSDYTSELDSRYGPWINPNYCGDATEAGYWITYLPSSNGAVQNPVPYFEKNPYNFMENYNNYLNEPDIYDSLPDYKRVPDKVWNFINATQHIVVPDGVDSIDVNAYYKNNYDNYNTYILKKVPINSHTMYTSIKNDATPGLFSGYYEDYEDDDDRETNKNGNDYLKSIVLTSVKSLPDYAFDSCEQLEKVELGAVEQIGELPFRNCNNLVDLTGNAKYPAENGILYEKTEGENEEYKIVECLMARGSNSLIPDKTVTQLSDPKLEWVNEIAKDAFKDCDNISTIDLSAASALKTIPEGCFMECDILSQVKLPASVNDIQDDAFAGVRKTSTDVPRLTVEIPGKEVSISDDAFGKDSDYPELKYAKDRVLIRTSDDTAAYRYADYYEKEGMMLESYPADEYTYSVIFMDYDGTQIGDTQYVKNDYAVEPDTTELEKADHRPGYRFTGEWIATNNQQLNKKITQSCIFLAQYESDGTTVNGSYTVEFYDSITSKSIRGMGCTEIGGIYTYLVEAGKSMNDMSAMSAPTEPYQKGYVFSEWKDANGNSWKTTDAFNETKITSNMRIMAMYTVDSASSGNNSTSGNTTNTSNGTTNNSSANSSNNSSNSSSSKNSSSTSSSNTSSSSNSSNTSGSESQAGVYTVTVENGSGSGTYAAGSTVIIAANTPAEGMVFQKWTTESNGVTLASVSMPATTFIMPANNVTVTANYVAGSANTPAATGTNGTGNGGSATGNNGNTTVDITKPGISNKDLATANVNGSTDNFIVKISETDEATQAVAAALTNKYGSLDNILYYAMDITLWDSTGTYQLTGDQTAGLSVDITIPIPDALVAYGGNNMAGAVVNGNQLENLNENFTTINGVPCIRFTATHFSPYTIYVDTGNLTEGMLDVTPKTGDPIHPKWFLSIGLACLSIVLFMKKDKKIKAKTK